MDRKPELKYMKGTTTVAMVCSDGIVMGADSRATMDTFIANTESRKLWKIDDTLAMTIAGVVGDAQELIRILKIQNEIYKMNEDRPLSPKAATSLLSIVLQQNKWAPFLVQLILGGIDGENKPQLYSIDAYGGYTPESKFTSTGSGSLTALGYLENLYKKNFTVKEAVKGVAKAVAIAMLRDSATGNDILVATITSSGYREYTGKELDRFISEKEKA